MEKIDCYGANVTIDNITSSENDPSGYFTLLRKLDINSDGGVVDLEIALADRASYSGHDVLAKRLYSSSTTVQLSSKFPYNRVELRSWIDCIGVSSTIILKGFRGLDTEISPDETRAMLSQVAAVAIGQCLETPLCDLDSIVSFSSSELKNLYPHFRPSIYI